jgi:hypothetical protein
MKRIGIGGLTNFDGALDTPQVVESRLRYMTSPWQDAFRYAVKRAEELGLEFAIASSPGWSETGGPWVPPSDGMKKLVWSETRVRGGANWKHQLDAPPSIAGPFQYVPAMDVVTRQPMKTPCFFADVAVVAYPTPKALLTDPVPLSITTSAPEVEASRLPLVDATEPVILPVSEKQPAWVLYDYGKAQRFRAVSLSRVSSFSLTGFTWVIEASDDGQRFYHVTELPDEYSLHHTTAAFPEVVARFMKLTMRIMSRKTWFQPAANAPGAECVARFAKPIREVGLYSFRLYSGARVNRFEDKAGFAIAPDYYALDGAASSVEETADPEAVVDLTGMLSADGCLDWRVPEGEWTVARLGYSLTGKTNHPASPEATGLEVDKLDPDAVKRYLDSYLDQFQKTVGGDCIGKQGIRALVTDSIESRGQNWTPKLIEEFSRRRGYGPLKWLPALTGVIVGDAGRTDRFLWDFRQTLIELMSEAHYTQIAEAVHARGMIYYSESLEGHATYAMGDDLDMRSPADIPMAAIWTNYNAEECDGVPNHVIDMLGAASVAHVYGKPLVAAEALTSGVEPWAFHPGNLRPVIDLAFALGVNRPVIHTSVHQPVEKKPGLSLGPFGQHFTRHETWSEMAGPWITYLSRCSYLLQQGRHVADVAWFYGEEGSLAGLYDRGIPADLPDGYGFDFISATMLLDHISVMDGYLVSSGGARYRLLYLGGSSERMTLRVLRKVKSLSDAGAAIAGRRPIRSPSLADEIKAGEGEYQRIVSALWDTGKIIHAPTPNAALDELGLVRDFAYATPSSDSSLRFLHRTLGEGEIYFVTNRKARPERVEASFRVTARIPELWHADTSERETVSWRAASGRTVVSLDLEANQSVFVVFRKSTSETAGAVQVGKELLLAHLDGDWQLSFEHARGAPAGVRSIALASWTQSPEAGIRYFSGIGTYRKTFTVESLERKPGERFFLDLGDVRELAEVKLNDRVVGTAWHTPFRLDVTDALTAGLNTLEIRVANLWVNRLIGDKQPGATPVAFTITSTYKADAPLRLSGLIGPVMLLKRAHG